MINGVSALSGRKTEPMTLKSLTITKGLLTMKRQLDEIHPGEILLEDFMKPLGVTARRLSADIDVPPSRISEIVNGARPITADTALRLGMFFSMEPQFWMNLQSEYDMRTTSRALREALGRRIRVYSTQHETA
jgi:antitoxin HigA-1